MRKLVNLLILQILLAIVPVSGPQAAERYASDIARAHLETEAESLVPGGEITVFLALEAAPGWHSYADPSGDAGLPTRIEWELPPELEAGPILWPPAATFREGGLTTYGYSGLVKLPTRIRAGADLSAAAPLSLTAKASWLLCKEICIPEMATLSLTLPVIPSLRSAESGAAIQPSAEVSGLLRHARNDVGAGAFWLAIGGALLGGLILNLMPCVFPVLSLKLLALARKGGDAPRAYLWREAGAYTFGVLACFTVLAGLLLAIQRAGVAVGWGFQMQSPVFVGAMALLLFAIGLTLSGVLRLPVLLGGIQARGSFATGLLAALVATPCTAPFMAGALAVALTLPPLPALLVFEALGLGLAAPFLLVACFPRLVSWLPKPGAWMERLKHILAVPMYLSALWLLWVLAQQLSPPSPSAALGPEGGVPYSAETLARLRGEGAPVFIDATAAWCITCQVNERTSLSDSRVREAFRARGVTVLVADWTRRDDAVTKLLESHGHRGVPMYLYFPPGGEAVALPQILTPSIVLEAIGAE